MNRRNFLIAAAASALLASTGAARADYADSLVSWLVDNGYGGITVSRTWLGRARVVAMKGGRTREFIINPRTGEVLRDVWISAEGASSPFEASDDHGGQNRGPGGSDDDSGGGDDSGGDDSGTDDSGDDDSGDDDSGGDDSDKDDDDDGGDDKDDGEDD